MEKAEQQGKATSSNWRWHAAVIVNLLALAVFAVVLIFAFLDDRNKIDLELAHQREDVQQRLAHISSSIEDKVGVTLARLNSLSRELEVAPELQQNDFAELVASVMQNDPLVSNVAYAPDLVISVFHPYEGNEDVANLDYRTLPAQLPGIWKAREAGTAVAVGPIDLVQGGKAIVVRLPLFAEDSAQPDRFSGIVSAVIPLEGLFNGNAMRGNEDLHLSLDGPEGNGTNGVTLMLDQSQATLEPVATDVHLPSLTLRLHAMPIDGWTHSGSQVELLRLVGIVSLFAILIPTLALGRMMGERTTEKLRLSNMSRRLDLALKASRIGVWELNLTTQQLFWDKRMRALYGLKDDAIVTYDTWANSIHKQDADQAIEDFTTSVETQCDYRSEFRLSLPNDKIVHIRTMGHNYTDQLGHRRIIGVNWDASDDVAKAAALMHANELIAAKNRDLEKTKADIEKLAMHDALTGLPNRRFLDKYLRESCANSSKRFALMHIDVDEFKQINDTLGHAAGDIMLKHAATVLRSNVGEHDIVARIGGDEFIVFCNSATSESSIDLLAKKIVTAMNQPAIINGRECRSGVSVGVAMSTSAPNNPEQLLINADIALYRAKKNGRNTYRFFTAAMHQQVISTKVLADEILTGIEQKQFVPFYQGQVSAKNGKLTGVEALARWDHPVRGVLAPAHFLDAAKDLNVLHKIDNMILTKALNDQAAWSRGPLGNVPLAVNVSARRLGSRHLMDELRKLNIPKGKVSFELVESTFLDKQDPQVAQNIDDIRKMGIRLEIDDFGTGYASIISLMQLRPDRLKIDRQLVANVEKSEEQRNLIAAIVDMANSLNIEILAEGVETMEQAEILADLGCAFFQGFAFYRPIPKNHFEKKVLEQAKKLSNAA